jgi:signal transduction histidine kinase
LISEKAKKNFLNNLSHEIRTPLNGIIGFLDIISQLDTDDFMIEKEYFSKSIRKSADHFLMIMNDLVELSFFHAGDELSIRKSNVDIVEIFTELKVFFNELMLFQDRKASVIYLNSDSSFCINTDGKKLKQILYHLINNALKFSEDNKVTFGFELKPEEKNISLFVKNKDSYIGQKDVSKIFDIFEKQENIGKELNFGLGIGLPLVKNLTDLLGGQIKVETENKEISFFVNIPIEQETASI